MESKHGTDREEGKGRQMDGRVGGLYSFSFITYQPHLTCSVYLSYSFSSSFYAPYVSSHTAGWVTKEEITLNPHSSQKYGPLKMI